MPQMRTRAEALISLSTGLLTLPDVLSLASSDLGKDLRVLTLREVLVNAKGVDAKTILGRLDRYGLKNPSSLKLRELIDKTQLLILLSDALTAEDRDLPTQQWPFAFSSEMRA